MTRRLIIISSAALLAVALIIALVIRFTGNEQVPSLAGSDTPGVLATTTIADEPYEYAIPSSDRISIAGPAGEISVRNFLIDAEREGTTFFLADTGGYWITYQRETATFIIAVNGAAPREVSANLDLAAENLAVMLDIPASSLCRLNRIVSRANDYETGAETQFGLDFSGCQNATVR